MNAGTSGGGSIATGNISLSGRTVDFGTGAQRIYGDNNSALYMDGNHSSVVQSIYRDKEDTVYGRIYGDGNGANFGLMDGDANWGIKMAKDTFTSFNINNTERMRILANGNVGIGTSSPSEKLHVTGNIRMDGNRFYFGGGNSGDFFNYATQQGITYHENGNAQWRLTGNGNNFINGGNVGIGTTSPETALHVVKAGNAQPTALFEQTGTSPNIALVDATNGMRLEYNSGADDLRVQASTTAGAYDGATIATFDRTGNVGIGTTTPSERLEVAGNLLVNAGGNYPYLRIGSQAQDKIYADNSAAKSFGGGMWFRVTDAAGTGYVDSIRLADTGNVGIGTNPTQKLDVAGTVKATAFQGNGAGLTGLNASNLSSGTLNLARIANNSIPAGKLAANSVGVSELSASGTKNASTFLRGNNTWGPAPGDNLGNHTASTTINANDQEIRNIRALQGKDWDDNTGGTDNKYRMLYRDGAHMFYDGGVAVGGWGNGTWSDLGSGD